VTSNLLDIFVTVQLEILDPNYYFSLVLQYLDGIRRQLVVVGWLAVFKNSSKLFLALQLLTIFVVCMKNRHVEC